MLRMLLVQALTVTRLAHWQHNALYHGMVISTFQEIAMLTDYYIRPTTVDRIQASWIASAIEQYVHWLKEHDYRTRSILHRVPVLTRFGEFAKGAAPASLHIYPITSNRSCMNGSGNAREEAPPAARGSARSAQSHPADVAADGTGIYRPWPSAQARQPFERQARSS